MENLQQHHNLPKTIIEGNEEGHTERRRPKKEYTKQITKYMNKDRVKIFKGI